MQLDWRIRLLDWLLKRRPPTHTMTLAQIQHMNQNPPTGLLAWLFLGSRPTLSQIRNSNISGRHGPIPIRLYYPRPERDLPLVVFFHGGGWVTGNLEIHDVICRQIALNSPAIVAAVDYRLAPQYRFPTPLEDCYDATCWLAKQCRSLGARENAFGVMGDSAGGNLAASVCLMARERGGPKIDFQILIYPSVDGTLSCASHQELTNAPLLSQQAIHFFRDCHARTTADFQNPYFSPLLATSLRGLPPALVMTAECDPLRDEGEAYARRLQANQVAVDFVNYPNTIHGFLNFPRFCRHAPEAIDKISQYMKSISLATNSLGETHGSIESAVSK